MEWKILQCRNSMQAIRARLAEPAGRWRTFGVLVSESVGLARLGRGAQPTITCIKMVIFNAFWLRLN
jgi:hypothetical protein